jgi:hypothetical protein
MNPIKIGFILGEGMVEFPVSRIRKSQDPPNYWFYYQRREDDIVTVTIPVTLDPIIYVYPKMGAMGTGEKTTLAALITRFKNAGLYQEDEK